MFTLFITDPTAFGTLYIGPRGRKPTRCGGNRDFKFDIFSINFLTFRFDYCVYNAGVG